MANKSSISNPYSLYQLCNGIERLINQRLGDQLFWIVTDLSKVNHHNRGHTYVELVELENEQIKAKVRATLWRSVRAELEQTLGSDFYHVFKDGNKVLLQVKVNFHAVHGLSFDIRGLDLNYLLGDIEKRKAATIKQLTEEGLIQKNKSSILPKHLQRFVVIGAKDSNGYQDFYVSIKQNKWKFAFDFNVWNTLVQGEGAVDQISYRLDALQAFKNDLDAIIILRGGGSKLDLEPFNHIDLCKSICNSAIPILTGVGHEDDVSVADVCAYAQFKTPTAVAEFILNRSFELEKEAIHYGETIGREARSLYLKTESDLNLNTERIQSLAKEITGYARHLISMGVKNIQTYHEKLKNQYANQLALHVSNLKNLSLQKLQVKEPAKLDLTAVQIKDFARLSIQKEKHKMEIRHKSVQLLDPDLLLEKGFAIVSDNHGIIKKTSRLKAGDTVKIKIYEYELICEVLKVDEKWILNLTKKLQKN